MANQPTKYRKFVVGAASAALVASAVAPVASAKDFSDTKGNTHEAAIDALSDAGIITGYEDGTFKPNKTLTRSDVVKMMGKWLVSEGYEVPSDYKTNPRFSDLTSASNDELLKYAAVVKDNGVFNGSNGRLLAGDNMSRENMAVVLVRAFDTVKDINLVEYVQNTDYKKEVTDLNSAKSEARTAIEVLDFFDITTVAQFNPKDTTTRGHFATFLNNFLKADLSQVTGVVAGVESITAVNNTTVEVKFVEAVEDLAALNFKIDGLEITNKVIKQTDAKTVVLTTAVQEGGKVYTVTANDNKLGTFNGVSAVVPTGISVTTPSVQGTIGKDVTVSAQVTVPEGQSKAGIPVTFNIVNDDNNLNSKLEAVAYTNAEGVASYTYTRYYAKNDSVTAYATDRSSVFSQGKVYWQHALSLTEVTEGNALANGSKKVYKIKTNDYATAYDANGNKLYDYVNVSFKENNNVTPDKLVRGVTVLDAIHGNNTYPSQVTTGGVNEVRIKVVNGEASFTLSGSNAEVTPIVFVDSNKDGKYGVTELQATAPTVKFSLSHTLGIDVKAEGVQNAAAIDPDGKGTGGREYTVTLTDKDGKVATKGSIAYVTFEKGSLSPDKNVYINGTLAEIDKVYTISVSNDKGEASFVLTGQKDAYATPTVFLNNGTSAGLVLDDNDLQKVGERTFFVNAVVNSADLFTYVNGVAAKTAVAGTQAEFEYSSVDQNGFPYYSGNGNYEVTFQVTAQFSDVTVAGYGTIKKGTTESVKRTATRGAASIFVTADEAVDSYVTVNASASQASLPNSSATFNFTKFANVDLASGTVSNFNPVAKTLTVTDRNGRQYNYSYAGATYKQNGQVISPAEFDAIVDGSTISVTRDSDGKLTFNVLTAGTTPLPGAPTAPTLVSGSYTSGDTVTIAAVPSGLTAYLAPAGTTNFTTGDTITMATSGDTSILAPNAEGTYKLFHVDSYGRAVASANSITVDNTAPTVLGNLVLSLNGTGDKETITITTSEAINLPVNGAITGLTVDTDAGATAAYMGNNTIVITSSQPTGFNADSVVTYSGTGNIKDKAGNGLAAFTKAVTLRQ